MDSGTSQRDLVRWRTSQTKLSNRWKGGRARMEIWRPKNSARKPHKKIDHKSIIHNHQKKSTDEWINLYILWPGLFTSSLQIQSHIQIDTYTDATAAVCSRDRKTQITIYLLPLNQSQFSHTMQYHAAIKKRTALAGTGTICRNLNMQRKLKGKKILPGRETIPIYLLC